MQEREDERTRRAEERRRRRDESQRQARQRTESRGGASDDGDPSNDEETPSGCGDPTPAEADRPSRWPKAAGAVAVAAGTIGAAALVAPKLVRAWREKRRQAEPGDTEERAESAEGGAEPEGVQPGPEHAGDSNDTGEEDMAAVLKRTALDVAVAAVDLLGSRESRAAAADRDESRA